MMIFPFLLLALTFRDEPFVRSVIEPPAVLEGRVYYDADGDGLTDILLFDRRRIWTYRQRPDHTFPRTFDHVIELSRGTTVFEFGNVVGTPAVELVELMGERLVARDVRSGERRDVVLPSPSDCLFHGLENFSPTLFWYLVDDLIVGGTAEVSLPTERGLLLFETSGPRGGQSITIPYAYEGQLSIDTRGIEGRLSKTVSVPLIAYQRLPPGRHHAIAISNGRTLRRYELQTDPARPDEPVQIRSLGDWTFEREARGRDLLFGKHVQDPDVLAHWRTGDLNGDGHLDLHRFDADERALLFVFGRPGERALQRPDDVLPLAASPTAVHLRDGNGDGRADLYVMEEKPVQTPKEAALAFMEAKLRGHVACRLTVFVNQGGDTPYLPNPSWVGTYPMRPKVGAKNGAMYLGVRMIVNTDSDFDGDGVLDLMRQPTDGKLEFVRGSRRSVYGRGTWATVAIDSEEPYQDIAAQTVDMDGDGRHDVILHYRAWDGSPREKMIVLMSRLGDR